MCLCSCTHQLCTSALCSFWELECYWTVSVVGLHTGFCVHWKLNVLYIHLFLSTLSVPTAVLKSAQFCELQLNPRWKPTLEINRMHIEWWRAELNKCGLSLMRGAGGVHTERWRAELNKCGLRRGFHFKGGLLMRGSTIYASLMSIIIFWVFLLLFFEEGGGRGVELQWHADLWWYSEFLRARTKSPVAESFLQDLIIMMVKWVGSLQAVHNLFNWLQGAQSHYPVLCLWDFHNPACTWNVVTLLHQCYLFTVTNMLWGGGGGAGYGDWWVRGVKLYFKAVFGSYCWIGITVVVKNVWHACPYIRKVSV